MTVQVDGALVPTWTFGDRLRKARSVSGMDQRDFAKAIGVTASSVAAWETDRAVPRDIVAIAKRVAMLTNIPAAWLLGVTPPSSSQPDGVSSDLLSAA